MAETTQVVRSFERGSRAPRPPLASNSWGAPTPTSACLNNTPARHELPVPF